MERSGTFELPTNKFVEDGGKEEEFDVTNGRGKRRSDAHDDDIVDNISRLLTRILPFQRGIPGNCPSRISL
ncbi:Hypothetical protein FKW44_010505 [Caligus rogercresseyi]|uniref:Uncharacterized protein n=1 Tax=Caligus rogercresseyi TaxID=217165 RepID=A0A7T8K7E4_CALRO|nr:Hypothetical protein FKW44_010505 [Caligus rogercresseyi]